MENYRTCNLCNVEKPLSETYFYLHKNSKGGFQNNCKDCQKIKSERQWRKIKTTPVLHEKEKSRLRTLHERKTKGETDIKYKNLLKRTCKA